MAVAGVTRPGEQAGIPWWMQGGSQAGQPAPPQTNTGTVGGPGYNGAPIAATPTTYDVHGHPVTPAEFNASNTGAGFGLQQDQMQKELYGRLLSATNGLSGNGSASSYGSGSSYGSPSSYTPPAPPASLTTHATAAPFDAGPTAAQQTASDSATYAKVKDNAAHTATASLTGLNDALASRGMTGGGYEAGQIGGTLSREANTIGEGDRQYATQQYADASHRADVNTEAGVAQRGQDIGAATAQRGQDLGAYDSQLGASTAIHGIDTNAATARGGQQQNFALASDQLKQQKQLALTGMLSSAMRGLGPSNPSLLY